MSVNYYDWGTDKLDPTAGKTVPAPTPDYVDEQYSSSKTYSKGMTCISGNVRYRYINSTASSGHQPPNATYWEVLSVSDELSNKFIYKSYPVNNVAIDTTWGAVYSGSVNIQLSSLGISQTPQAVFCVYIDSYDKDVWVSTKLVNNMLGIALFRPTTATVTGTLHFLIIP